MCYIRPPAPGKIYFCAQCHGVTNQATLRALAATTICLLPELLALLVILAILPASGQPNHWLVIPIILLAVPRIRYVFASTVNRVIDRYIDDSGIYHVWIAEFTVKHDQERDACIRNAVRREAIALGIPLTPNLEKLLNGEIQPEDLSDRDIDALSPAVAAAMKRHDDRAAALGIDANLPRGDDPVC